MSLQAFSVCFSCFSLGFTVAHAIYGDSKTKHGGEGEGK